VAGGHLREAELARQRRDALLVSAVAVGVHVIEAIYRVSQTLEPSRQVIAINLISHC